MKKICIIALITFLLVSAFTACLSKTPGPAEVPPSAADGSEENATAEPTDDPANTPGPTPMPVRPSESFSDIPLIIAGKGSAFAVYPDGSVYAWGGNEYGQLGVGNSVSCSKPVRTAKDLAPVSVGDTVYAIDENGVLWGWGRNDHGQLGTGDSENRDLPFEILENVREVFPARNRFTCYALTNDGSVYKWGWEEDTSLTDEERAALSKPTVYYENVLDFKINSLVTSDGSLMALSYSGEWEKYAENAKRLWCDFRTCPIYEDGAGDLWSLYGNEPTLIARNVRCVSVSGNLHEDQPEVFVLADDGSLYRFDPLTNTTDFIMNEVVEIYADCLKDEDFAYEVRFALKANGELWSWGQHSNAALGKSADNAENAPALVMENVKEFLTNGAATYVITESGELYASGINASHSSMNGALGDGSAEDRYGFVQLLPGRVCRITNYFGIEIVEAGDDGDCAILISRTYAVDDAGHIWAWGWNDSGFLGVGSDEDEVLSPTELLNE